MKFKEPRLLKEYAYDIKPDLRYILLDLDEFTRTIFGVEITITCLNRTKEENEQLGGVPLSAHLDGRAADIRSHVFTENNITSIRAFLATKWPNLYFLFHSALTGPHIHINIKYKTLDKIA